jgi:hypothetical protein
MDYIWTAPAGVTSIQVECWGGGGGGSGACPDPDPNVDLIVSGNGGGGGGYARSIVSVTPGVTYNITVGGGGQGGAYAVSGGAGENGGHSYFESVVVGKGGFGATCSDAGLGGSGSVGDFSYSGGPGHLRCPPVPPVITDSPGGGGSSAGYHAPGTSGECFNGGIAPTGGGNGGVDPDLVPASDPDGTSPGGGGQGGHVSDAGFINGGDGAPGRVIICGPDRGSGLYLSNKSHVSKSPNFAVVVTQLEYRQANGSDAVQELFTSRQVIINNKVQTFIPRRPIAFL